MKGREGWTPMQIVCDRDPYVWIPDGTYEAQVISYDEKFCIGKARKLFLNFRIVAGANAGTELFMAFNIPYDQRIRPGSKYYKTWAMVNGWRRPSRNAKMSPRLFLNKVYRVKTRTVRPKHNDREMPGGKYSVVDSILEVLTGVP
jgi:hypothetical protein